MRLGTIRTDDGTRPVAFDGGAAVDLISIEPQLPRELKAILEGGADALEVVSRAIDSGRGRIAVENAAIEPPILKPDKFIAIGLNYADHIAEVGRAVPEFPVVFSKWTSCIVGPYADVERPVLSDALDYEGELGIVIGTRCRHVSRERAHEVVAGYVIINDYSIRDYQLRTPQYDIGKSFDTTGAIGPWIVTADEIDPHDLKIETIVNGEVRQSSNTSNLVFDCFDQIELLSGVATLQPGDIIATGTPGGVGNAMSPKQYLAPGDVVRVEVEGIGAIENRVVAEPTPPFVSTRFDATAKA
jgi:2-keto-4-pentenoate hydratase/2-oxohepta-3-ene-1,7-dioic acid hydratase in catechol pathway